MSTIRGERSKNYTTVSNTIFNDIRLTWEAKGLAGYIFTKPDTWVMQVNHLWRQAKNGQDVVKRIFRELEAFGYLRRTRRKDDKGQFIWEHVLYEEPQPVEQNPSGENHSVDSTDWIAPDIVSIGSNGLNSKTTVPLSKQPENGTTPQTSTANNSHEQTNSHRPPSSVVVPGKVVPSKKRRTVQNHQDPHHPHKPLAPSSPPAHAQEQQAEWDRIPQSPVMNTPVQGKWAEMNEWAKTHKLLDKAPDFVKEVSFIFYDETGGIPAGTLKNWIAAMSMLWKASRQNTKVLRQGLADAVIARQNGISFSTPYSYQGLVRNAADKHELASRSPERRSKTQPSNQEQPLPFGQEWVTLKDGRRVVRAG